MGAAASRLLAPQLRGTTLLLASTWLLNMMGYYGVVLLATEIHLAPDAAAGAADAAAGAGEGSRRGKAGAGDNNHLSWKQMRD